jgi:hypothetical protein
LPFTDGHAELIARDSLILDILRLTERLGIAFDSPTLLLDRNGRASPALETGKGVTPRSQENRTRRSGSPDNGRQLARLVSGC